MTNGNPIHTTFPNRTKAAEKLARWIAHGVERKKTVALAGKHRLWSSCTEAEIRVGFHGYSRPVLVLRRGEQKALRKKEGQEQWLPARRNFLSYGFGRTRMSGAWGV